MPIVTLTAITVRYIESINIMQYRSSNRSYSLVTEVTAGYLEIINL